MNRRHYGSGWASKQGRISRHPIPNVLPSTRLPRRWVKGISGRDRRRLERFSPESAEAFRAMRQPSVADFAVRRDAIGVAWASVFDLASRVPS